MHAVFGPREGQLSECDKERRTPGFVARGNPVQEKVICMGESCLAKPCPGSFEKWPLFGLYCINDPLSDRKEDQK